MIFDQPTSPTAHRGHECATCLKYEQYENLSKKPVKDLTKEERLFLAKRITRGKQGFLAGLEGEGSRSK